METKKVKLLKVLAYPVSAAFMLGVGTVAINACEQNTDASACIAETEVVKQEQEVEEIVENETTVEEEPSEEVSDTDQIQLGSEANEEPVNYDEIVDSQPLEDENQNEVNNPVAQVNGKQYETLQGAIDAANEGDTVNLTTDVTEDITINKSITLDLGGKTITGTGANSVISVICQYNENSMSNLKIQNGTITGGKAVGVGYKSRGGGILIYHQTNGSWNFSIELSELSIINNEARSGGGLSIALQDNDVGLLKINNCNINNNKSVNAGNYEGQGAGGIEIDGKRNLTVNIIESQINGNDGAKASGGGISVTGGILNIESSSISNNLADMAAGIHISSSNKDYPAALNITNSKIQDNKATATDSGSGGGIGFFGSNYSIINISDTIISNNKANRYGGGIYFQGKNENSVVTFGEGTVISNNESAYGGGVALYQASDSIIPSNLVLSNNTATGFASDLYSYQTVVSLYAKSGTESLDECGHTIDGWYWDTNSGYEWRGHSDDGNYYVYKYGDNLKYPKNYTLCLKAAHGLAKVTVEYVYKDGTTASESVVQDVEYGGSFEIQSPQINGYKADNETVSGSIEETDRTLKVVYSKLYNYAINYDANGGTGAPASKKEETTDEQKTFTISSVVPSRDGYTFKGWATSKDAKESDVSESVTLDTENTEITLYAIWEKNPDSVVPDKKDSNSNNKSTSKKVVGVKTSTATNIVPTIGLMGVSLAGIVALKKKNED